MSRREQRFSQHKRHNDRQQELKRELQCLFLACRAAVTLEQLDDYYRDQLRLLIDSSQSFSSAQYDEGVTIAELSLWRQWRHDDYPFIVKRRLKYAIEDLKEDLGLYRAMFRFSIEHGAFKLVRESYIVEMQGAERTYRDEDLREELEMTLEEFNWFIEHIDS
jgi:hypothetical protein